MKRLVITGPIASKKTNGSAAGITAYSFYLSGILYSMSRPNIDVIDPVDCCSGTVAYRNSGVTFRRIARRYRFIPHIGVVNFIVCIDCNRRIGPLRLGKRVWHAESSPRRTTISAKYAALQPVALIDRQPGRAIGGHMNVAVETAAGCRALTRVSTNRCVPTRALFR